MKIKIIEINYILSIIVVIIRFIINIEKILQFEKFENFYRNTRILNNDINCLRNEVTKFLKNHLFNHN